MSSLGNVLVDQRSLAKGLVDDDVIADANEQIDWYIYKWKVTAVHHAVVLEPIVTLDMIGNYSPFTIELLVSKKSKY